jgi:hypothetical protein
VIFVLAVVALPSRADTPATNAARELARKIAPQLDLKQTAHIEFRDLTNEMGAAEISEAQHAFENELTSHGFRFTAAASAQITVKVSLSADSDSRLWIAEYTQDAHTSVAIVSFASRPANPAATQGAILIQRQLILSQPEPILDFAFAGQSSDTNTPLLVLSPASISVMRFRDKSWQLHSMDYLQLSAPISRDLQGEITVSGLTFEARLANILCSGTISDVGTTRCASSSGSPWDSSAASGKSQFASAAAARNWFDWSDATSATSPRPSFFGVAGFATGDQSLSATANTDGEIRIYGESSTEPTASLAGFGSQIEGVQTGCGTGWQILTTTAADYSKPDAVQAQEWTGREFRASSAAVEFEGPVLALRRGTETNSVRAIVHNLKTGMYEAYTLNVFCNR